MTLSPKRSRRRRTYRRAPTDSSHVRHINIGSEIIPRPLCGRRDARLFTKDLTVLNLCKYCHDRSPKAQAITRERVRRFSQRS